MSPELEKLIGEHVRTTMGGIINPIIAPEDQLTDWPGGQAAAMRDMSFACSPSTHRAALQRLCEKLEDLVDGKVSGVLTNALSREVTKLVDALSELKKSSGTYAEFQESYARLSGTIRLALETGTKPWNFVAGLAGMHPYQVERTKLENGQNSAFTEFNDAFVALLLAFESAISRHTGKNFSFRGPGDDLVAEDKSLNPSSLDSHTG